jgi:demethoxyubiquinone hydroxylase (CLK1/Coq7/Cat5 family)
MDKAKIRRKLIKLLQKAHAGERSAALAYQGHWKSLKDPKEIAAVQKIEADEWRHRAEIHQMLVELNAKPLIFDEMFFFALGKFVALVCRVCGRFFKTYFAGMVENGNVSEYQRAVEYADSLDLKEFAEVLREMRKTEFKHEMILQKMISDHWLLPFVAFFFGWGNNSKFVFER